MQNQLTPIEEYKVNQALLSLNGKRADIFYKETIGKQSNFLACQGLNEGCVCRQNPEIFRKVCIGEFNCCPIYSSIERGDGLIEDLTAYYGRITR